MSQRPGDEFYDPELDGKEAGPALPGFLLDPVGVFNRRWRWMILGLIVGLVATGGATLLVKPEFTAKALVLVTSQRISVAFETSTVESNEVEKINAILSEIKSRQSIVQLVEDFNLFELDRSGEPVPMQQRVTSVLQSIEVVPEALTGGTNDRRRY